MSAHQIPQRAEHTAGASGARVSFVVILRGSCTDQPGNKLA